MEKALGRFRHKPNISRNDYAAPDLELSKSPSQTESQSQSQRQSRRRSIYNHNGHKVTRGIHPDGESGRFGIHPWHFLRICFRSTCKASMAVNVLWPFVLPAIVLHFVRPDLGLWIFILNYIAMVPTANLIGFAGQELARKLPKVLGTSVGLSANPKMLIRLLKVFSWRHFSGALWKLYSSWCCYTSTKPMEKTQTKTLGSFKLPLLAQYLPTYYSALDCAFLWEACAGVLDWIARDEQSRLTRF